MKKITNKLLASLLVLGVVTGATGCSSKSSTSNTVTLEPVDQSAQGQREAFTVALVAESKMNDQFMAQQGLEGGKTVTYMVPVQGESQSVDFLGNYWDSKLAKKEFDSYLGDPALVAKANAAFQAQNEKDNQGKKAKDMTPFTPVKNVANTTLGTNDLFNGKATFETCKITVKPDEYIIQFKGLTYIVANKDNSGLKVIEKDGHL